jgi:hypothetical protein
MFSFAGIGNREGVSELHLHHLMSISEKLVTQGGTLRSGNATGCDFYCQSGAHHAIQGGVALPTQLEIYLPEEGFNMKRVGLLNGTYLVTDGVEKQKEAEEYVKMVHPHPERLYGFSKKAHTRNIFQILGQDLETPVDFVICYTRDGAQTSADTSIKTGGTATAINLASEFSIPVFNSRRPEMMEEFRDFIRNNPQIFKE